MLQTGPCVELPYHLHQRNKSASDHLSFVISKPYSGVTIKWWRIHDTCEFRVGKIQIRYIQPIFHGMM